MSNDLKRFFQTALAPLALGAAGLMGVAVVDYAFVGFSTTEPASRVAAFFSYCVAAAALWGILIAMRELSAADPDAGELSADRRRAARRAA